MRDLYQAGARPSSIAEKIPDRFFGPWPARVIDNDDPERRGRLKLHIPDVHGRNPWPEWVPPIGQVLGGGSTSGGAKWGGLFLPESGDFVEVEFTDGDPRNPRYLPGWYKKDELPALLRQNYPRRRGLVTPSGHALILDDSAAGAGDVLLKHRDGAALTFAGNGEASLTAKSGSTLKLQGGGAGAARIGDEVRVTIPPGTVVVNVVNGVPEMNVAPITLTGSITQGSQKTQIG